MAPLLWGELRRRWRSAAVIGVVLGIGFAAALTAAAGARRTDSAFPRMIEATNAPDLLVSSGDEDPITRRELYDRVAEVQGVQDVGLIAGVGLVPARVRKGAGTSMDACSNIGLDRRAYVGVGAPNVLSGRLPRPDRADEVLVTHQYADVFGARVGDELVLIRSEEGGSAGRVTEADGPAVRARVVGVGVLAAEVVPVSDLEAFPKVVAGPAFLEQHAPDEGDRCYDAAVVALAPGADIDAVTNRVAELEEGSLFLQDLTANYDEVRRAIQPQVTALWLFAATASLASLLLGAQLLGRRLRLATADAVPVWRALGLTRAQIRGLVAVPSVVTAGIGAGVAVLVSLLLSSRFPIGPARLAETARGMRLDPLVHLGGGLLIVAAALAIGVASTLLVVGARERAAPAGGLSRLRAATSRPALTLGLYLTTHPGRGDQAVPVRSAVAGTALCIAAAFATVTCAAGLLALVSEPERYGQDWDMMIDASFGAVPVNTVLGELGDDRTVAAIAGGRYGEVTIEGRNVPTVGLSDLVGTTFPAVIDGRPVTGPDEIVLGKRSLADIGREVGDRVTVDTGAGPVTMTVVGTAAFPRLSHGSFSTLGLGVGAVTRTEAFPPKELPEDGLPPGLDIDDFRRPDGTAYEFLTIRLRGGATEADRRAVVALASELPAPDQGVRTEQRPTAIDNYAAVSGTPVVLAALLGSMAAATLLHLVVSVLRRRRRDLALCAALGMDRPQLLRAVVVQTVIVAGAALVVGLPLGVVAGRLAWSGFAAELGVSGDLRVPVVALSLAVPVVVVSAVAVVIGPALRSTRTSPAPALRQE